MTAPAAGARLPAFLWLVALGNLVVGTGGFVIGGMIEPLSRSLGLSVAAAGQLMTVYAIANAIGAPMLIALTSRYEARRVLPLALVALGLTNALSALATSFGELAAARVLMALAAGVFTATGSAMAVALVAPAQRGRAISVVFSGISLAYIVGVPLGTWAAYRHGWQVAFWVVAATALALTPVLLKLRPGAGVVASQPANFRRVLRNPRLVLALSITVTYAASVFTIFSYIGAFLRGYADLSPAQVSTTLTGFGVAALAGNFVGGWGTDRLGATRMLYAVCVAFAAIFAALWALPGASGPLVAITLFWGTVGFAFMSAQTTRLVAMSPQDAPALMSLNSATISGGTALGAAIGGAVIAVWGYRGLPVTCAALVAVIALLVRVTEPTPVAAGLRPQAR